jgi:hypothetical protein
MRLKSNYPFCLGLAALVLAAPLGAVTQKGYTRHITVGSSLFIGLKLGMPQKGTVTVKTLQGKELGKLDFAGSCLPLDEKGTYTLEFSPATFDLNVAIVKSRMSTGAYVLNLNRTGAGAKGLKASGAWEGDPEGNVTVNAREGQDLLVID